MNNHASNNVGNDFLGWRLTKTNFVFIVLDFNLRGKREILPEGDPSMFNKKTTQKQLAFAWAVDVVRANTCVAMANCRIANRRICVAKAKIGRAVSCFWVIFLLVERGRGSCIWDFWVGLYHGHPSEKVACFRQLLSCSFSEKWIFSHPLGENCDASIVLKIFSFSVLKPVWLLDYCHMHCHFYDIIPFFSFFFSANSGEVGLLQRKARLASNFPLTTYKPISCRVKFPPPELVSMKTARTTLDYTSNPIHRLEKGCTHGKSSRRTNSLLHRPLAHGNVLIVCISLHWEQCSHRLYLSTLRAMFSSSVSLYTESNVLIVCISLHWEQCSHRLYLSTLRAMFSSSVSLYTESNVLIVCISLHWEQCSHRLYLSTLRAMFSSSVSLYTESNVLIVCISLHWEQCSHRLYLSTLRAMFSSSVSLYTESNVLIVCISLHWEQCSHRLYLSTLRAMFSSSVSLYTESNVLIVCISLHWGQCSHRLYLSTLRAMFSSSVSLYTESNVLIVCISLHWEQCSHRLYLSTLRAMFSSSVSLYTESNVLIVCISLHWGQCSHRLYLSTLRAMFSSSVSLYTESNVLIVCISLHWEQCSHRLYLSTLRAMFSSSVSLYTESNVLIVCISLHWGQCSHRLYLSTLRQPTTLPALTSMFLSNLWIYTCLQYLQKAREREREYVILTKY